MIATRTLLVAATLSTSWLAVPGGNAEAASRLSVKSLAQKLSQQAKEVYQDIRQHHRSAPDYVRMEYDAAEVYYFANHMRRVADVGGIHQLEGDLADLAYAFKHLSGLVSRMPSVAGPRGIDHPEGNVFRLRRQVREMEDTFHRLQRDARSLLKENEGVQSPFSINRAETPRTRYPFNYFRPHANDADRIIGR